MHLSYRQAKSRDNRDSDGNGHAPRRQSAESIRTGPVIDDYANLQGDSLLNRTLGYVSAEAGNHVSLSSRSYSFADDG